MEAVFLVAFVFMLKVSFSRMRAKRKWRKTAIATRSVVADIRETIEESGYYGEDIMRRWQVGIQLSPDQPVIWADVKKVHYEDYARRRTALVYQSPDDPLTFLLEDEL
ncbi:MAG: hypothetical protein ACOYYS_17885 [Chloroflexota bacterium]